MRGWIRNTTGDAFVALDYVPILLPKDQQAAQGAPYNYGNMIPKMTVGARFCECSLGDPISCNAFGPCTIDSIEYSAPGTSSWWRPSLADSVAAAGGPGATLPNSELLGLTPRVPDLQMLASGSTPPPGFADYNTFYRLFWDVSADGAGFVSGAGAGNVGFRGVLWTHVVSVAGLGSSDAVLAQAVSNHYQASVFGRPGKDLAPELHSLPIGPGYPPSYCPHCSHSLDTPYWQIDPVDQLIFLRARELSVDLTEQMPSSVLAALVQPTDLRLSAEEPAGAVPGDALLLASVSAGGSRVEAVVGLRAGHLALLGSRGTLLGATGEPELSLASGTPAPEPRTAFGAALSSTEGGVLLVGGLHADGNPVGDAWISVAETGAWLPIAVDGPLPGKVLATGYRGDDRSLFLVDEYEPAKPSSLWARVFRIDLASGKSDIIGVWPRHKHMDRVFLSIAADGRVALAGTSTSKRRLVVTILRTGPTGKLLPSGGVISKGVLAFRPTLTSRGLTLPIENAGSVHNEFVATDGLHEHPTPGPGDCL